MHLDNNFILKLSENTDINLKWFYVGILILC